MDEVNRNIYQKLPCGILQVNIEGLIEFSNIAFAQMFGFEHGQLQGKDIRSVLPHFNTRAVIAQCSEGGEQSDGKKSGKKLETARKFNGSHFKVDVSFNPVAQDANGILLTVSDATEHQSVIESLQLSQAINKTATWSFDLKSNIVWWSPELFRIFNLPPAGEAPPYETHHLLFSPDSWLRLEPAVAAASEKGIPYELELELARKDDSRRYAVARCEPQLDDAGNVVRLVGTFQDVSSLKHAEMALEESVLRLNEAITAGGIGLWDWDLTSNKVSFSEEYKRQLGYEADEFGDEFVEWQSRVHPDDLDVILANVQQSIESRNINHESTFRLRHKDGSYRWILAHASIFTDNENQPIRMLGSHIDITEQRKLEAQLRHSQKMESIGRLAGGVAHDFNNQLASIMGFAELIAMSDDLGKIKNYIQRILKTAQISGNLTKQLLTFSRQEQLKLQRMDAHNLILETIDVLSHSIDKNIDIRKKLDARNPHIVADPSLLQNALLNLGVNAKDAMPEGGVITISTSNVQDSTSKSSATLEGNTMLEIRFSDNGCGIAEKALSRVFDPFYTTKEAGRGTGLGLASVYGALEQMHGSIVVESKVNEGTTFIMRLPLQKKADEYESRDQSESKMVSKTKTVLLVDDEPLVRQVCEDFLSIMGHQCLTAGGGEEAIKVYQREQQNIDLVILDMIMPDANGKEVFKRLKQIKPDIKAIISSGYMAENTSTELMSLGVCKVIQKPFELSQLEASINELT